MSLGTKKIESPGKGRLFKCLRDVDKLHTSQGVGQWPNNSITLLERNLGEICRILEKQVLHTIKLSGIYLLVFMYFLAAQLFIASFVSPY